MADNTELDPMSGGDNIRSLDFSGVKNQQIVNGNIVRVEDTMTPLSHTDTYAVGDLVAVALDGSTLSATSSFVLANAFRDAKVGGLLTQIALRLNSTVLTDADFRVHFFDTDPFATAPVAGAGDQDPFNLADAAADDWLGAVDVSINMQLFAGYSIGVGVPLLPMPIRAAAGTTIWGVLQTRAAYVGKSSQAFDLYAQIAQG